MKTKKKVEVKEKIESLPVEPEAVVTAPSTSATEQVVKISYVSGDFGREDLNALKNKINEVIDFLNKL